MTPVDIGAAIQAGKAAFDTIKGLAEVVNKSQDAAEAVQITASIADLSARVTEMQAAIFELSHENEALHQELRKRDEEKQLADRMRYEETVYWRYTSDELREPDPFCPVCFEKGGRLVHLKRQRDTGSYFCEVHRESYKTKEYVAPQGRLNQYSRRPWM